MHDRDTSKAILRERLKQNLVQQQPQQLEIGPAFRFARVCTDRPDHHLTEGQTVSISLESSPTPLAAVVQRMVEGGIRLLIIRPSGQLTIQTDSPIRVKYWTEYEAYSFDSHVLDCAGVSHQNLLVARPQAGVSVQRRRTIRIRQPVPFAFTVVKAAREALVGEVVNTVTEDIGMRGLRFETGLPFRLADRLDLTLSLPRSKPVRALGWVVRHEQIGQDREEINSVAVEFVQLDADHQNRLLIFFARTRPEQGNDIFWVG